MGAILSSLREGYFTIQSIIDLLTTSTKELNKVVARISNPEPPSTNSTASFWMNDPAFPQLCDMQSPKLSSSSDVVIIGSGITGASIVYTLLTEAHSHLPLPKIVILEARALCSGATGRNGGHIKCAPYAVYSDNKRRFGMAAAKKIVRFQRGHVATLLAVVEKEDLEDTEAREVQTVDAFTVAAQWSEAKAMVQELRSDAPELAKGLEVWEADDAHKEFGLANDYCGAITYTAGAMWPYQFVMSLYNMLLTRYPDQLRIETHTPATDVQTNHSSTTDPYTVSTPRGQITTRHVVHATNAHTANLLSPFKGKIFAARGHMTAQQPGQSFPDLNGSRSWGLMTGLGFEYMTQRPIKHATSKDGKITKSPGGELMLGGGLVQAEGDGNAEFGIWRDDTEDFKVGAYLGGLLPYVFKKEEWGDEGSGPRVKQSWSGSLGFTVDLLPFVGRLPPSLTGRNLRSLVSKQGPVTEVGLAQAGEWISAGFNGEGMPQAWLSGTAVALMILGKESELPNMSTVRPRETLRSWFPEQLLVTEKRIKDSSLAEFGELIKHNH